MLNQSRIDIYEYIYAKLFNVVSQNVYSMGEPQELTSSDVNDGFIVVNVGDINDSSEFSLNNYATTRVYIRCYIPPKSRGRLNKNKYSAMEKAVSSIIDDWANDSNAEYGIVNNSLISIDNLDSSNKDNLYHIFVKSFVVIVDNNDLAENHLYIGLGNDSIENESQIKSLVNVQHYIQNDMVGDYVIIFPNTMYLWICTTSTINKVVSSEIDVPMNPPILINSFNCYRSSNAIIQGEMEFSIN